MTDNKIEKTQVTQIDIDADIAYFREKLAQGLKLPHDVTHVTKQIELLEDALVVYRLTSPARS